MLFPLHPRRSPRIISFQLTHNVHGPHDDTFYKYLAGLEAEYEDLKRSGYAGEGFHSPGIRLGVGTSHNLPPHLARLKALEAAEKRRARGSGGGRRLGYGQAGTFDDGSRQLTPRELALRVSLVLCPLSDSPFPHSHISGCAYGWSPLSTAAACSPLSVDLVRLPSGGGTTTRHAPLESTLKGKLRKPQRKQAQARAVSPLLRNRNHAPRLFGGPQPRPLETSTPPTSHIPRLPTPQ